MFFFSGIVFPINSLPKILAYVAWLLPLSHVVSLARAFCIPGMFSISLLYDLLYCMIFIAGAAYLAIKRLGVRMEG